MRRARSRPRYLFFLKLAFGWVAPEERKSEPLPARAGCAAEYSSQQLELKKGPLGKHNILVERVPIFAGLHFRRRERQWRVPSRCSHVLHQVLKVTKKGMEHPMNCALEQLPAG